MYILHEGVGIFEFILNTSVKIARIWAWCIAIFGSLFVAMLATNTIDRATEILNVNILSKWWKSIQLAGQDPSKENTPGITTKKWDISSWLTSNALSTHIPVKTETSETITQKRAALLEARKTARLQQEKLKEVGKIITQ
jgi:hypothetical protein